MKALSASRAPTFIRRGQLGKVLKIIATVAAIAGTIALVVTSGGAALALAPGLLGMTVGGTLAVIGLAASIGASLLTKPKQAAMNPAASDRLNLSLNVNTPRIGVFGRTAMGTDLRDQEVSGANKEFLHRFGVSAAHKVNSFQEIWFDDKMAWSAAGGVQGEFVGYLTVTTILEGGPGNVINLGSRMGSGRRYTGCAYVYFRFKLTGNTKKTESPFASQVPTRVTIIGEGMPCYDPRLDSTRPGGSGTHRADNQATWAYGAHARNPAIQLGTWMLGWKIQNPQSLTYKLSVGSGIPASRIDWPSIIESANLCDEMVTRVSGGSEPRYRSDGVFSEASPSKTMEDLKACMNADLDDQDGLIRLTVFHNDLSTPDCDLTAADVEGDYEWIQTTSLDDSFNIVRGNYVDPATLYQAVPYKEAYITPPDSIDRVHGVDFSFVQSKTQAERLAKQRAQRQQYTGTFRAVFLSTAWRTQKNGIVRFNFSPEGFVNKIFRVVETAVQTDGKVPMLLRVEHAQIYAWDNEDGPVVLPAAATEYTRADTPYAQFLATVAEGATVGAPTGTNVAGTPAETVVANTATALANSTNALTQSASAQTAAAAAQTEATAASTAAISAANSQTGAAASAVAAEAAKVAAEAAKVAAQTAKGAAEVAKGQAESASTAAAAEQALALAHKNAAAISATSASGSATTATGQATISTDQASAAATSATVASGHAGTATTQAGIATTQATAASGSASTATTASNLSATYRDTALTHRDAAAGSATTAGGHATTASTQAGIATTQATNASNSASSASSSSTLSAQYRDTALTHRDAASGSATTASGHATTASNQATISTTQATNASNSATSASSASTLSAQYRDTALTHRDAAAGSATTASSQATISTDQAAIATAAGSTATTQAGIAAGHAGTANTQAGISTTQATTATNAASAASSSSTLAAQYRDTALGHRDASSTSATNASNSATTATAQASTATTQANLSANFAGQAKINAALVAGADFARLSTLTYWGSANVFDNTNLDYQNSNASVVSVAGEGAVYQIAVGGAVFRTRRFLPVTPGRTYRFEDRVRTTVASNSSFQPIAYLGYELYDAAGTRLTHTYNRVDLMLVANGWQTRVSDQSAAAMLALNSAAAYVAPIGIYNYRDEVATLNSTTQLAYFRMTDITELAEATSQATISTNQAASATASASSATTQAGIAAGHAGTANTQAGVATTQAANASSSAASAASNVVLSASFGAGSSLLRNPVFADYPNTGLAIGTINFGNTSGLYRSTGFNGSGYGVSWDATPGAIAGIYAPTDNNNPGLQNIGAGWYVFEVDLTLRNGRLFGLEMYVSIRNSGNTEIAAIGGMGLWNTAENNMGVILGDGELNKLYSFKFLRQITATAMQRMEVYFFNYGQDTGQGKHPTVYKFSARPATINEIREQTVHTPTASTVATHTSQIAALVTADSATATSVTNLTARIGSAESEVLNSNPRFGDWPNGSGSLPTGWSDWIGGSLNTRVAGDNGGYAFQQANALNEERGLSCNPPGLFNKVDGGWLVLEADITLNSGSLTSGGLHIAKAGYSNELSFSGTIDPMTGAAYGAGTAGRRYKMSRLFQSPANGGTNWIFYLMTGWSGFTGTSFTKNLTWHSASVRFATPQEIRDQTVVTPLQASVTTQATAITTLQGRTAAFWNVTAVAGGRAQLSVFADANGGAGVDIVGDLKVNGNLLVTGTVNSTQLGANAASSGANDYVAASINMSTVFQTAAEVGVTMIGGTAKIDFACYLAGQGNNGGTNILYRLLRNGVEIRTGTLCLLPGEQTVYGGFVGDNPQPVYTPIAGMFPFFVLDTAGVTGGVTYTVQLRAPVANYSSCYFAERQLSVTEFRR